MKASRWIGNNNFAKLFIDDESLHTIEVYLKLFHKDLEKYRTSLNKHMEDGRSKVKSACVIS